jgi:hypothetical protein
MDAHNSNPTACKSRNSDLSNNRPCAEQECSEVINISLFFDGTGNNKEVDLPLHRWSNPARLWFAAQNMANNSTNFAIYISGVGTPFNGEITNLEESKQVFREDKYTGNAAGGGGTRRTQFGQRNVNEALRIALLQRATKFNALTQAYANANQHATLNDIARTLKPFNLITVVNLSIIGFSRGAALARAFVNDLLSQCQQVTDGKILFNHHPLRIRFLGLFDTVASFGLPSKNVDMPFDEKNLIVPIAVERCVHLVAAHELRFSFPVDLIRERGCYQPNWTEIAFPGVHSDVGGGYEPNEQGISNDYARIPMQRMMREAILSGLRMMDCDDFYRLNKPIYKKFYSVNAKTITRFQNYMKSVNPSGTIEQTVSAHMRALYSGLGTMSRRNIETPDLIASKGSLGHTAIGHIGIAREARLLISQGETTALDDTAHKLTTVRGAIYRHLVHPEKWRLQAWQTDCSDAVLDFIRHSVHDSKAGFIYSIEPFSYFRPRGMAESSRNVLAAGLDWLDDRAADARDGIVKIYHSTEGIIVETWEFQRLVASRTYKIGEKFIVETVLAGERYAVEVVQSGKKIVITTMEKGGRVVVTSIETMKEAAGAVAVEAQKNASNLTGIAGYETDQLSRKIKRGAGQVVDGAETVVDVGVKLIDDIWTSTRSGIGR